MPIGKWVCLAWRFSGPTNELQLSSDSGEITDMHVTNKGEGSLGHDLGDVWLAPTFASTSVGWESVQTDAHRRRRDGRRARRLPVLGASRSGHLRGGRRRGRAVRPVHT
jgi:hypothetical protein